LFPKVSRRDIVNNSRSVPALIRANRTSTTGCDLLPENRTSQNLKESARKAGTRNEEEPVQ